MRHSVLYKANRRNEVRTSEPVCRADTESPSSIEGFNLFSRLAIRSTMRFRVVARNDAFLIRHPELDSGSRARVVARNDAFLIRHPELDSGSRAKFVRTSGLKTKITLSILYRTSPFFR